MDLSLAKPGALRLSGHLCFPYESADEKRVTLVAFVAEGLARHERCLYIGAPADQTEILAALEAAGVELINEGDMSSMGGRGVRLREAGVVKRARMPARVRGQGARRAPVLAGRGGRPS